jgi:glycosyltransferase involved in cell wall biosynthesis
MAWVEHRRWLGPRRIDKPRVFYGYDRLPGRNESASGGIIKCQDLEVTFPNCPVSPNLLYLISSVLPPHLPILIRAVKQAGIPIVLNQNGVAYPAWHGAGWGETNKLLSKAHSAADYIFYQSIFCRDSAWRFLGKATDQHEVLYNPVDTSIFIPEQHISDPILLVSGSHHRFGHTGLAVDVLADIRRDYPNARLVIAGRFRWGASEESAEAEIRTYVHNLLLDDHVDWVGAYRQIQAPNLLRQADILLHTKYNDACPRLVVEGMACGLPVVYSASGGVPELVGDKAGIGIPAPSDWNIEHPPSAQALGEAVRRIIQDYEVFSEKARERAVANLDVGPWLQRHREVFHLLTGQDKWSQNS